jgi:hypothetical protein
MRSAIGEGLVYAFTHDEISRGVVTRHSIPTKTYLVQRPIGGFAELRLSGDCKI